MLLSEVYLQFRNDYIAMRGLTASTEENYSLAVLSFTRGIDDKEISEITPVDILSWRRWMERRNSTGTIRAYLSKLKNVLIYSNKKGFSQFDVTEIYLPKMPPPLPEVLSPDDIHKLIQVASIRDRAIISLMFTSGIRAGELSRLVRNDIEDNRVFIRKGKCNTSRTVFMSPKTQMYINDYLATRNDHYPTLFLSNKGGSLCTGAINKFIKSYALDAGITKPIHSHMLRHSFATTLVRGGTDISYVQRMMGHAFVSTTQIYVHLTNQDLQSAHSKVFG